ncbi:hypothetical protein THL1_4447 [Pseudomonas sp. TCU-HL1]|nr:hypothetical protein THL1_4447 [Pseudomonas sp. TCU-HL1]
MLTRFMAGALLVASTTVNADPPKDIKIGTKYMETQMERLVSYRVDDELTIFVRSEFGPFTYGQPVNNDLFLVSELQAPRMKSLGELVGMVRMPQGSVAYKKLVECEFFENKVSSENGQTYRLFDCTLQKNPRAEGGKPVKVIRNINGDMTFR